MLLTYSKTQFKELIIKGVKVHTIRDDRHNRWKVGNKIHFWLGNPRNTRGKTKPFQFAFGVVSKVEKISIVFSIPEEWQHDVVSIGENIQLKTENELHTLAINDGFENWSQMRQWFYNAEGPYLGKIIYWENFVCQSEIMT